MPIVPHRGTRLTQEVRMTFFISDNYRSGICMAIIEIGRREERIRRSPGPIPLTVTTDSLVRVSAKLENESSHPWWCSAQFFPILSQFLPVSPRLCQPIQRVSAHAHSPRNSKIDRRDTRETEKGEREKGCTNNRRWE